MTKTGEVERAVDMVIPLRAYFVRFLNKAADDKQGKEMAGR